MRIPKIVSIIHKEQIEAACQILPKINGMKHFVCYIVFNNGQTFVLSNIFHMLIPYYVEEYYKQDYSFRREITSEVTHYLCNKTETVSANFSDCLESRFSVYRAFYIVRNSPECQFVFGCIPEKKPDNYDEYYKLTLNKFEDFCCDFLEKNLDIIKLYNPLYANSIVLNDKYYRNRLIKGSSSREKLTAKEIETLHWIAYGKSAEETAIIMSTTPANINFYRNQVKKKLDCANIAQSVFEGVRYGYLGAFNAAWRNIDYVLSNFTANDDLSDEQYAAKINSLLLLNNAG